MSGDPDADRRGATESEERLNARGSLHRVERPAQATSYSIQSDRIAPPSLPGEVVAARDLDELLDTLAADVVVQAANCVRKFGDCHLALSGDPLLEPLYERLMYDPNCRSLPWRRTHLWVVDEAAVGFDDPRSAFRRIRETIVDHSDIPPEQVHPIFPLGEDPAAHYESQLREVLAWRERGQDRLDVALLAAGGDGTIAGLSPCSSALLEAARLVALTASGEQRAPDSRGAAPPPRVTMTLPLLNATRFIGVIATGADRAEVVRRLVEGHDPFDRLPARGLHPTGGALRWYLDADAAGVTAEAR
jgi:6-phosphogluconolactonase